MNVRRTSDDSYDTKKSQERFEAALKGALMTPHKPLKEKPPAAKQSKSDKKD